MLKTRDIGQRVRDGASTLDVLNLSKGTTLSPIQPAATLAIFSPRADSTRRTGRERPRHEGTDDLGVGEQITWTGFIADTAELYRAADVFSLLSANEGMPNALLEAMACGLPSIVTRIPGTSDLVREGEEALIVEPTAENVADALSRYTSRSQSLRREHGSAARKRAVDVFSARRVLERHIQLYRRSSSPAVTPPNSASAAEAPSFGRQDGP